MRSDDKGNRIVNARELTVTGLSRGTDLLSHKNSDDTVSITTEDIKPLQNHDNVRLEDGTIVESADILATRIITWGLPGIGPVGSETGNMPSELNGNLVGIDAMLRNGIIYRITCDITSQMHEKPTGGIITVYFDANDIPESLLNNTSVSYHNGHELIDLGLSVK